MIKTSIVILNWNGEELLKKFLPSVLQYSCSTDVEVIVIDNKSSDNSINLLRTEFPTIKLIALNKNYGFAEGYNRGIQQIQSQYIVLLNSDVEVTENWLNPLIDYLDKNPNTVAVQPKILSYREKHKFEYAGASGGYLDRYSYPFCRGRVLDVLEEDKGQYDDIKQVFWATGACLCIRRVDYIDIGGLDKDFFAHMEEIDLCWRLQARGKTIFVIPQSKVYHLGGASLDNESPRKTYLNFRNNLLMIYKNTNRIQLIETMFVRFFLDILAAIHFLFKNKLNHAQSVIKAYSDFITMLPAFKEKRKENIEKAVEHIINPQYRGSILFDFYLRNKKTFSSIMNKKKKN